MHLSGYDQIIWLAGLAASFVLLCVLYVRRRELEFPIFKAIVTLSVIRTIVLYVIHQKFNENAEYYNAYYYTYLCFAFVDDLLQVGIAYEIGLHVFRPRGRWSPGSKSVLIGFTTIALLLSLLLGWVVLPATAYLSDTLLLRSNFSSAALVAGLFACLMLFSVRFGLPWKTYAASIATGLGVYCAVGIVIETLKTYLWLKSGTAAYAKVNRFRAGLYFATLVFWIVTLSRRAPTERELPESLQRQLLAVSASTTSLLTALRGGRRA